MGKFSTILTKQEAEAYRAQGLHQEAMRLYDQLLSSSPHIDAGIRTSIHARIQDLEKEMQTAAAQRERAMTAEEITRIRNGWGNQASETDIWVCGQSFFNIGAFTEALAEFDHLLRSAGLKTIYIHAAAECLAELHAPSALPGVAEAMARTWSHDPKHILSCQMIMVKHLQTRGLTDHARSFYLHLREQSACPPAP